MSAQDILVIAEAKQDSVADATLELLGGARALAAATGGRTIAVVLSADGSKYVPALSAADRILLVNDPALANYAPEPFLAALAAVISAETPRAVLVASTSIGWDLAPSLAAKLGGPLAVGCTAARIDGDALLATCGLCGGKMMADVRLDGSPALLMVLSGSFGAAPAAAPGGGEVAAMASPVALAPGAIEFQQWLLPEAGDVDITSQEVLVAVGRGIQQQDNLELAQRLADLLGGAVCASRPIVDQGWLPPTRQVGKSGMTVKPKLYLALGISGAPEHQEGMAGADLIVAVNTDPKAPIFDVADYGVEMDLLDLVEPLAEAIEAKKANV